MNPDLFTKTIAYMQALYGHTLNDQTRDVYRTALHSLSDKQFKAASEYLVQSFVPSTAAPFPLPAHFLRGCGEDEQSRTARVIGMLQEATAKVGAYSSVDFKDPALHTTIQRYGGWPAVCRWTERDWQLNSRAFSEAYSASLRHGDIGPAHLAGVIECQNGQEGEIETVDVNALPEPVKEIESR